MTLATYDALSGGEARSSNGAEAIAEYSDSILRAAMSIEMFHKASLVHDDIEDDDGFRYGQPTCTAASDCQPRSMWAII